MIEKEFKMDESLKYIQLTEALEYIELALLHAQEYLIEIDQKDSALKFVQEEVIEQLEESVRLIKCICKNIDALEPITCRLVRHKILTR